MSVSSQFTNPARSTGQNASSTRATSSIAARASAARAARGEAGGGGTSGEGGIEGGLPPRDVDRPADGDVFRSAVKLRPHAAVAAVIGDVQPVDNRLSARQFAGALDLDVM